MIPGPSRNWRNYLLFNAARAKDYPQYYILRYIVAEPTDRPAEACDIAGFKEIKETVSLYDVKTVIVGLN